MFNIGLLDPAWKYTSWNEDSKGGGIAAQNYKVMEVEDMMTLPVKYIFDNNAIMFLWATWTHIKDAIKLMEHWGFEYKTAAFVWVKKYSMTGGYFIGNGYYTRANSEFVLLGTRGSLEIKDHSISQIIDDQFPIQITSVPQYHSKKPDSVKENIVRLLGNLPRAELFARQKTPGWNAFGNEIDGKDLNDSLNEILKNGCDIESKRLQEIEQTWW